MPSIPEWCPNAANRKYPGTDLQTNGFKPTTTGDNFWLNYIFNLMTLHVPIPIGIVVPYFGNSLDAQYEDYLYCDGSTFGSAASTATNKSDDYHDLFIICWEAGATITPSKGADAESDWAANKDAELPNMEGKILVGKDESFFGQLYTSFGQETVMLTEAMLPAINTQSLLHDPGHVHHMTVYHRGDGSGNDLMNFNGGSEGFIYTSSETTGITIDNIGLGQGHPNVQPSLVTKWFIKY